MRTESQDSADFLINNGNGFHTMDLGQMRPRRHYRIELAELRARIGSELELII